MKNKRFFMSLILLSGMVLSGCKVMSSSHLDTSSIIDSNPTKTEVTSENNSNTSPNSNTSSETPEQKEVVHTGPNDPDIKLGAIGDLYINFQTWDVFRKTERGWEIVGNIRGEHGEDGVDGQTPVVGENGTWWINGKDTYIRAYGVDGQDGKDGQNGEDGDTPYIGADGNWWIGKYNTGWSATGYTGSNGQDGRDGATPYIGENGNWWIGMTDTKVPVKGEKGEQGDQGVPPSIGVEGNWWINGVDTGIKARGHDGQDGQNGHDGQDGTDGKDGVDGKTPYINNGYWWIGDECTYVVAGGQTPEIGPDNTWVFGEFDTGISVSGILSVDYEVDFNTEDTYVIFYFNNGNSLKVKIPRGKDGVDGQNGTDGKDGKSAYEIYKETFGYEGTEEEWLNDLVAGRLGTKQTFTVTFNTNGGGTIPSVTVKDGEKLAKPTLIPQKEGFRFIGWAYNGEMWAFNGYVVTSDMTLDAIYEADVYNLTLKYNNGTPSNTTSYKNGTTLNSIEEPIKEDHNFVGWRDEDGMIVTFPLTMDKDMVLSAEYTNTVKLIFDTDGGDKLGSVNVVINSYYNAFPIPRRGNDTFLYWTLNGEQIGDFIHIDHQDITLKAVYKTPLV